MNLGCERSNRGDFWSESRSVLPFEEWEVDWVPEKVYDKEGDFAGVRS